MRLSRTALSVAVAAVNSVHPDGYVSDQVRVARVICMVTYQHSQGLHWFPNREEDRTDYLSKRDQPPGMIKLNALRDVLAEASWVLYHCVCDEYI